MFSFDAMLKLFTLPVLEILAMYQYFFKCKWISKHHAKAQNLTCALSLRSSFPPHSGQIVLLSSLPSRKGRHRSIIEVITIVLHPH